MLASDSARTAQAVRQLQGVNLVPPSIIGEAIVGTLSDCAVSEAMSMRADFARMGSGERYLPTLRRTRSGRSTGNTVVPWTSRRAAERSDGWALRSCAVAVAAALSSAACAEPEGIGLASAAIEVRHTRQPADPAWRSRPIEQRAFVPSVPRPVPTPMAEPSTPADPRAAETGCSRGEGMLRTAESAITHGFAIVRAEVVGSGVDRMLRLADRGPYGRDLVLQRARFEVRAIESCTRWRTPSPTFFVNHVVRQEHQRVDGTWERTPDELLDGRALRAPLAPGRTVLLVVTPDPLVDGEWVLVGAAPVVGGRLEQSTLGFSALTDVSEVLSACSARAAAIGVLR